MTDVRLRKINAFSEWDNIRDEKPYCSAEDVFYVPQLQCSFRDTLQGLGRQDSCGDYNSLFVKMPSSFLVSPLTQAWLNDIVAVSRVRKVFSEELAAVFQNALPEYSIHDRLVRIRSYLLFRTAADLNRRLGTDAGYREQMGWQDVSIDRDFDDFADQVLNALQSELGDPNVMESEEIRGENGVLLSGDYQEVFKKVRIVRHAGTSFFDDWSIYVTFHEFYHWYDAKNNFSAAGLGKNDREWSASRIGMKALMVLKGGNISFPQSNPQVKADFEERYRKIDEKISRLPLEMQIPFEVVLENIKKHCKPLSTTLYLRKLKESVQKELRFGKIDAVLEQDAKFIFERWFFSRDLVAEMESIVDQAVNGEFPDAAALCDPLIPLMENSCKSDLRYILSLALQNQIPLALLILNKLFQD